MKINLRYSCVIVIFVFVSCSKDEVTYDNFHASENFNRTIKFTVTHVYNISPVEDSVIAGATINVYDNYFDFVSLAYPSASRVSDSTGCAEINALDQDYYYIRASYPGFADITDSVSTPANTTSFVEMVFY